jgi:hypothetical protein
MQNCFSHIKKKYCGAACLNFIIQNAFSGIELMHFYPARGDTTTAMHTRKSAFIKNNIHE